MISTNTASCNLNKGVVSSLDVANTHASYIDIDHANEGSQVGNNYIVSSDENSDYVYIFLLKYQLSIYRECKSFDLAAS